MMLRSELKKGMYVRLGDSETLPMAFRGRYAVVLEPDETPDSMISFKKSEIVVLFHSMFRKLSVENTDMEPITTEEFEILYSFGQDMEKHPELFKCGTRIKLVVDAFNAVLKEHLSLSYLDPMIYSDKLQLQQRLVSLLGYRDIKYVTTAHNIGINKAMHLFEVFQDVIVELTLAEDKVIRGNKSLKEQAPSVLNDMDTSVIGEDGSYIIEEDPKHGKSQIFIRIISKEYAYEVLEFLKTKNKHITYKITHEK